MRKRFIAGAVCPECQQKDTLAMWQENSIDIVECVKCGHQMRQGDKKVTENIRHHEQIIGVFTPE